MLPPRFLWLLLPLSCWCGYMTAPRPALKGNGSQAGDAVAPTADPQVLAWSAELAKATAPSLEKELLALLAQPDSPERAKRIKLICARWAELDPTGALAWCEANKEGTEFIRLRLLTEWALLDSEAAWKAIPDGKEGENQRSGITYELLNEDLPTFMWWFRQVKLVSPDNNPAWLLVAERYEKDLLEIATELSQAPNGKYYAPRMFELIAHVKALRDPAAALEWASKLEPDSLRKTAVSAALDAWAEKSPREVWQQLGIAKGLDRSAESKVGQAVLERIAKDDPAAAIALLREAPGVEALSRRNAVEAVRGTFPALLASGKLKPLDAYRLIDSVKGEGSYLPLNTMNEVFRALPPDQLAGAAKAIAAEPPGDYRGAALGSIASAWLKKDPEAALAFISTIPDPELRADTYAGSFSRAGGGYLDPELFGQALADIPPADRAKTFADYMGHYGDYLQGTESAGWGGPKIQPELLAPALMDLPPSAEWNRSVTITAQEWGKSDPAAALAWADGLRDPAAKSAAYAGTFETWAARKPNEAAGWLADKPTGPERDAAALPVVKNLIPADAEIAWEWAGSIGDAGIRQEARLATLKEWAKRDPQAAQDAYHQISRKLSATEAEKLSACLGGS
ncbi:hypothetical protein [Haloferula sp. BvORR071]|uniref:hypothetical protein n=1 Tax=Haloferula sp. BvORR071 TaxID=1396141 RepID=UPI002240FFAB|nr:hypothetical protein [Haloferula sp. BvORR071]